MILKPVLLLKQKYRLASSLLGKHMIKLKSLGSKVIKNGSIMKNVLFSEIRNHPLSGSLNARLFVCLFECTSPQRKEIGCLVLRDFASHPRWVLIVMHHSRSILEAEHSFLLPYARSNPNTTTARNRTWRLEMHICLLVWMDAFPEEEKWVSLLSITFQMTCRQEASLMMHT